MSEQKPKLTLSQFSEHNHSEGRHILIIEASISRRALVLSNTVFSIGRHPQNSLVINSKMISRHHATIAWLKYTDQSGKDDYCYWLIDGKGKRQRSRNGVKVNGEQKSLHRLQSGDVINLGNETKITYSYIQNTTETQTFLKYCSTEKTQYKSQTEDSFSKTTVIKPKDLQEILSQQNST